MALGCGAFGPLSLPSKRTEKEWNPNPDWREEWFRGLIKGCNYFDFTEIDYYLAIPSKFYGAEYANED